MSLKIALDELRSSTSNLQDAVSELVMTVHEDQPLRDQAAVIDHLAEVVLELQASVAEAAREIRDIDDVRQLPAQLPAVDASIAATSLCYWRDLRSHGPLAELRRTTRRRGVEWSTWQSSLEQSQLRCEEPLMRSTASVRAAWQEVGELLSLYLPSTSTPAEAGAAATPPGATTTRRP